MTVGRPATAAAHGRTARATTRWRLVLLAPAGIALVVGMATGLGRLGLPLTTGPPGDHGPLMVLGFVGTLIALERAVASGTRLAYLAPAASGLAAIGITVGLPLALTGSLLAAAGLGLLATTAANLRAQPSLHLAVMTAAAAAWPIAAGLWLAGATPTQLVAPLAAFLVLTIVAERLELSRLRLPPRHARQVLVAAIAVLLAGATVSLWSLPVGWTLAGTALSAQAVWLARYDIARGTVRRTGLPRFAGACLLSGFTWLGAGGVLWVWHALAPATFTYDAAIHAVFLGFVMAMIFGHAPIILPAVLRLDLPYHPVAYIPLALLHASLAARIAGDLLAAEALRTAGGIGNATAIAAFVGVNVALARPRQVPA